MSLPATMVAEEAVNRAFETTLAEGVRFERRTFHATFGFDDRAEGMAAFADEAQACLETPLISRGILPRGLILNRLPGRPCVHRALP